jgi:toxin ParE1/3/4
VKTVFHDLAWQELVDAYSWHEELGQACGAEFATAMHRALIDVGEHPLRFPRCGWHIRRCLILRFHYAVIYEVKPDYVYIVAIKHTSRRPGYWKSRVTKK